MGKQKGDPNRSKDRPSSSSSAAYLLKPSNALSIGFGGFIGSSRIEVSDTHERDHTQGDVYGETALHLRRLSKKDSTTRVKALKALTAMFKEQSATELSQMLPNWIFEYKKLVQDNSQQVREGAHNAMSAIVMVIGRGLAPHLRSVMGAWWVSQFDPVREVSAAAQQSFQFAFQEPARRLDALMFCANEVLMHIDTLLKFSPQTISDKSTPIEESTKIYEQVISSALLALSTFLDVILSKKSSVPSINAEPMGQKKNAEKLVEIDRLARRLYVNHKYFQDYAKSKSSQIRCATYQTLRAFAQNLPAVFRDNDLTTVAAIVLGSFSEKDPSCYTALWDMVLLVSKEYPEVWDTTSVHKFVLPRFWAFLRHMTHGSAKVSYPCILPLLSFISANSVKPATEFFSELFLSLWAGCKGGNMEVEDEIIFLKTVQECFSWTIKNSERYAVNEGIFSETLQYFMAHNVLLGILWKNYVLGEFTLESGTTKGKGNNHVKKAHATPAKEIIGQKFSYEFLENLRACITEVLAALNDQNIDLVKAFWEPFLVICLDAINTEAGQQGHGEVRGCIKRISEFLSHLGKLSSSIDVKKRWLITYAVRPLVDKLFPLVKSMEYIDAIQLLAKIVSIYGPFSFPVKKLSHTDECYGSSGDKQTGSEADNWNIISVSLFLKDELIPWCLDASSKAYAAKIDLLLSFFEDERLRDIWSSVLSYATKLEDALDAVERTNDGKLAVLATLTEKFRLKFYDLNEGDVFSENKTSSIQWDLSKLDGAALAVSSSLSLSNPSSLLFLRNVLGGFKGKHSHPMVSKATTEKVLRFLLERMLKIFVISENDWVRHSASSILKPEVELLVLDADKQTSVTLACISARVICGSIFSLEFIDNLEIASKIVASFFCILWAYSFFSSKEQEVQSEAESETADAELDKFMNVNLNTDDESLSCQDNSCLQAAAYGDEIRTMITEISLLFKNFRNFKPPIRMHVQNLLVQCIRYEVFEGTSDISQMASTCGEWVLYMMDELCIVGEAKNKFLDMLLEPASSWLLFTKLPRSITTIQEPKHIRIVAFVDKLGSLIGWEQLVACPIPPSLEAEQFTSESVQYKIWLLNELLCSWCWPGGTALNTVLPFLVSCADSTFKENILNGVIDSLFMAAITGKYTLEFNNKFWMGLNGDMNDIQDPFLRALLAILGDILMSGKVEYAQKFFKLLVIDKGYLEDSLIYNQKNVLPFILSIVAPVLRKQQKSSAVVNYTPFKEFTCKLMHASISSPPLGGCSESIRDLQHPLWTVVACFPLHSAGGSISLMTASATVISSEERNLLMNLSHKEASDGSVAGFVAHVAKQQHQEYEGRKDVRHIHQEILAKLLAATVAYCWKEFKPHDWAVVISHIRAWLEAALYEAENFMQLVSDSLQKETNEPGKESFISNIHRKLKAEVTRPGSRSDLSWTAIFIFSLVRAIELSTSADSCISVRHLESNDWAKAKDRALKYILRILFSSGMTESIVKNSSGGEQLSEVIAMSRASHFQFWENLSEIVLSMSDEEKREAAVNLNVWTVGKDSVRALYALLFSWCPLGALQHAAYSLLTSSDFQKSAITSEDFSPSPQQLDDEALNVEMKERKSEQIAKLRHDLAVVLETPATTIVNSSLTSPLRVKYYLAWAIFLKYLRFISVSSSGGERLVQYLQDTSITFTLLDLVFQHIQLKSEIGSLRRRESTLWQGEIERLGEAARRACAVGSVSFAVEGLWPLNEGTMSVLASGLYGLVLQVLPACVRVWFTGLRDRSRANLIELFTTKYCSPQLLDEEFSQVYKSTLGDETLTIKANQNIGEVTVVYKKEEAGMDMLIRLPKCYPLRAVDIDCTRRLGISETRLRKWMLSMAAFLRNQNGAVAEAIQIWKQNVDREFEGVEECPICYSIIHTANHSLPRLACKTCKHKFHAACLYKWFSTSHKSTCPLCQTPF